MGIWGSSAYDSDDALDWLGETWQEEGLAALEEAIDDLLRAPFAENETVTLYAYAAAETVAICLGFPDKHASAFEIDYAQAHAEELRALPRAAELGLLLLNEAERRPPILRATSEEWRRDLDSLRARLCAAAMAARKG